MKRLLRLFLLTVIVLTSLLTASSALAQEEPAGPTQVDLQATVSADEVVLRDEPSLRGNAVATLPGGTLVGIAAQEGIWSFVYDGENAGWVNTANLDVTDPTDALADLVQTGATIQSTTPVVVRDLPGPAGQEIGRIPNGTPVKLVATRRNFDYVIAADVRGWVTCCRRTIDFVPGVAVGSISKGPASLRDAPDGARFTVLAYQTSLLLDGQSADGQWIKVRVKDWLYIGGVRTQWVEGWVSVTLIASDADLTTLPVVE
jgi:hypothetical protein